MKRGIIVVGIIAVLGLGGFLLVNQKEKMEETAFSSSAPKREEENNAYSEVLPSLDELKGKYGMQVVDMGEYRIITAFYKENPRVQMENEQGELMELAISSIKEEEDEVTFTIDYLETVKQRKKLGDRMKLIQSGKKYYEYQ